MKHLIITLLFLLTATAAGAEEWDKRTCKEKCTFDEELNFTCYMACMEAKYERYYIFDRPKIYLDAKPDCHYTYSIVEVRSGVTMGAEWEYVGPTEMEEGYRTGMSIPKPDERHARHPALLFRKRQCK